MAKFLIVGLGNPGNEYAHTRHNIGFDVLNAFALKHNVFFQSSRLADVAEIKFKGKIFVCIKPTTFMNLSGRAVKYWMDKEKISIENSLTIVDDLALPLDKLRLRKGEAMRDIMACATFNRSWEPMNILNYGLALEMSSLKERRLTLF